MNVELDLGDGPQTYRRETNTMPQWAGSCWYYLRYLDPHDDKYFCAPEIEQYWMARDPARPGDPGGVDLYVGGVEHAVLHLLYARFWHKVLYDLGEVTSEEPFRRLFNQGYIQAYAYTDARGSYVPAEEVVEVAGRWFHVERRTRHPGVREDGQVAAQRRDPGRDVRALRRRHLPPVRDVDRADGRLPAVVDPRRRRVAAVPAAGLAQPGRRDHRRVAGDATTSRTTRRCGCCTARSPACTPTAALHYNTAAAKLIELNNHLTKRGGAGARGRSPSRWC